MHGATIKIIKLQLKINFMIRLASQSSILDILKIDVWLCVRYCIQTVLETGSHIIYRNKTNK